MSMVIKTLSQTEPYQHQVNGALVLAHLGAMQFAIEMMDKANVAVAPGTGFSEEGEGFLRLALVENEERLRQAVRQMKKAMENMNI